MSDLRIETTEIPGLLILRLGVQYNDDGWFKENWHREKMVALGLPDFTPVQHNVTHLVSRGITRGFYAEPWDRVISLAHGRLMGAWVDLREGPAFGQVVTRDLDRSTSVFVPRGVANAHQVLEDNTTLATLLEHHWTPEARNSYSFVNLFDPALRVTWPIGKERAIVAHRDRNLPSLADTRPMLPRRILVAGTETQLGRALVAELPGAIGLPTEELQINATRQVDLSAFNAIINAHGDVGTGAPAARRVADDWEIAAERAHRLADIARRHGLRYVHISVDPSFDHSTSEHPETDPLSLHGTHSQALAAGEIIAAGIPRHLVVRTGWVIGREESFVDDIVTAARRGERCEVIGGHYGRLTFAHQLAAGITHLLDSGASPGLYNVTGDGKVTTWPEIAQRIYQIAGADPRNVIEVTAGQQEPSASVLSLEKVKSTGFRPGNSWLELIDHVPRPGEVTHRPPTEAENEALWPKSRTRPYRVVFVCTANICRSAYADIVARRDAPEGLHFSSAGTRALVGHAIDPPMAAHVGERGDVEAHHARQLTRQIVEEADLILAMAADHRRYILDEWPALGRKVFVIGHVARILADLPDEVTLDGLVEHLWRHRTLDPGDEVADPYRRGPEAAGRAADQIDGYLTTITSTLGRLAGNV